jgi:DNA-binding winged helix-turn-helix (wHTH) protein
MRAYPRLASSCHHFDRCQIDAAARILTRNGRTVDVEPRVFDLLVYLIEHHQRVVASAELLDAVWGGTAVSSSSVAQAVHKARIAVGDDGTSQRIIATCRRHGFRFVASLKRETLHGVSEASEGEPSLSDIERTLWQAMSALREAGSSHAPPLVGPSGSRCALCSEGREPVRPELPCLAFLHSISALLLPRLLALLAEASHGTEAAPPDPPARH